jgi:hypothetical protein
MRSTQIATRIGRDLNRQPIELKGAAFRPID